MRQYVNDLHQFFVAAGFAHLNDNLVEWIPLTLKHFSKFAVECGDARDRRFADAEAVDRAGLRVGRHADGQRIHALQGILVIRVGASRFAILDYGGRLRRRESQGNLSLDGRLPKREHEERQQLEGHVEHGRQIQLDVALAAS